MQMSVMRDMHAGLLKLYTFRLSGLTLEGLRFFGSLANLRGVNMTPEISGLCIRYHGMSYIIGKVIQNGVEIRSNHLDITCLTQVINCLCLLFNKNRKATA